MSETLVENDASLIFFQIHYKIIVSMLNYHEPLLNVTLSHTKNLPLPKEIECCDRSLQLSYPSQGVVSWASWPHLQFFSVVSKAILFGESSLIYFLLEVFRHCIIQKNAINFSDGRITNMSARSWRHPNA